MLSFVPWTRSFKAKQLAEASDFGRCWGWTIEIDGRAIGDLSYVRECPNACFWHDYSIRWFSHEHAGRESTSDYLATPGVALRNKRYPDVVVSN